MNFGLIILNILKVLKKVRLNIIIEYVFKEECKTLSIIYIYRFYISEHCNLQRFLNEGRKAQGAPEGTSSTN